jgi:peptidoglycan/xylan/chitin deacetylase (PgdA/CDA1 family)
MPALLIPAALGVAAAAGATLYAGLSDESQLFGPVLVAPSDPHALALTFDDGPNPAATPRLLDVLARHNVRATFFLIGAYVLREPGLTRELAAAGHTLGNHTMHHLWLPRHANATIRAEIAACNATLEDTLGQPVTLFRPPHGARRPAVLRIARSLGLATVQWNLMVGDWKDRTAGDLVQRMLPGIAANRRRGRGTSVVLHDGSQHDPRADRTRTVDAVARLLAELPPETRFVTPPQWR